MMRLITTKSLSFIFLSLVIVIVTQARELPLKKDFRKEWLIYQNNGYELYPENGVDIKTIYFWLQVTKFGGDSLWIESTEPFSLFVNAQLVYTGEIKIIISIDSLQSLFNEPNLLIGIHQDKIIKDRLNTGILSQTPIALSDTIPISFSSFRDFAIAFKNHW